MSTLSEDEIATRLGDLPGWKQAGHSITRTFEAPSFPAGITLVGHVGEKAEEAQHHPDIDIRYTKVTFILSTHSEGGLTEKDFALAGQIDEEATQLGAK